jgi:uncharacterized lipoprotein YajG
MRTTFSADFKEAFVSSGRGAVLAACLIAVLSILITGCGGPLKVVWPSGQGPAASTGVSVEVAPFTDARTGENKGSRTIGKIATTVADMSSGSLTLERDVAGLVTEAFEREFSVAGYTVKKDNTDFVLSGEVREFRLDVGSRDEITIVLDAKLTERETGKVLWSGTLAEKNSRYAGVMGNSRTTISRYITASLGSAVKKALDGSVLVIANTKAAYRPADTSAPKDEKTAPATLKAGTGRLVITTEPARSKVYINGVYWGLTPFSADMEPGVYELSVKQKGFRESTEKVSVRTGQMTELEVTMEKE